MCYIVCFLSVEYTHVNEQLELLFPTEGLLCYVLFSISATA